jgi:hypothetical protein
VYIVGAPATEGEAPTRKAIYEVSRITLREL